MEKIRVFEAFAGIGAQHEGWARLAKDSPDDVEFEFVGMSEIDEWATISYRAAHGDVPNYGDISQIDWDSVPDFDMLTYSSPCQDFSQAGKQAGGQRATVLAPHSFGNAAEPLSPNVPSICYLRTSKR